MFISGNRRKNHQKWGPEPKDFATIPVGPETISPEFAGFPLKSLKMQLRISLKLHLLLLGAIKKSKNIFKRFPIIFRTKLGCGFWNKAIFLEL